MLSFRYYQTEAIDALFDYFGQHSGNPIAALPTGTGKSLVIAGFLLRALQGWPQTRVLCLTHVKELIAQNHAELIGHWPTAPAGIFSAGLNRREVCPITFGGIASVAGKPELFGHVDLVVIDECHLVSPNDETMYDEFLAALREVNPRLKVIGLTATPYRLGQGRLIEPRRNGEPAIFTDVAYDVTGLAAFNRLIAEGFIAPLIPKKTGMQLDVSQVGRSSLGDYKQGELEAAVDKTEITRRAIEEMIALGSDRRHWLVFASGVNHVEHVSEMLNFYGIAARSVHSKSGKARDTNIADFKAGKVRALVNNGVLTTGFNFKPIDLIGVLRPTISPGLWVQMLGRGTRPSPETGKTNCLVLDFAGNTARLGPINDPVIPIRKGSKGNGVAPVKLCDHCGVYNHASVRVCSACQAPFPPGAVKLVSSASDRALIATEEEPVVTTFAVDSATYKIHHKIGKPDSIQICHHCGLRRFTEYLCLEHEGYAARKSRILWRERSGQEPPATTAEAFQQLSVLRQPKWVRVWINRKHPEIVSAHFTNPDESL